MIEITNDGAYWGIAMVIGAPILSLLIVTWINGGAYDES